jgi:hypothetical protein
MDGDLGACPRNMSTLLVGRLRRQETAGIRVVNPREARY